MPNRDVDLLPAFWDVMPAVRATLFGPNPRAGYCDPLAEPEEVRTAIRNHAEFGAFRTRVQTILDGWAGQNAPLMDRIQLGDKPRDLIHTIAEDMLSRFAETPVIDRCVACNTNGLGLCLSEVGDMIHCQREMEISMQWRSLGRVFGAQAIIVLDGAGWHAAKALTVPDTIILLPLPPYAPELNPLENV